MLALTLHSIDEVVVRFLAMWDKHCDNAKKTACVRFRRPSLTLQFGLGAA